MAIAVEAIMHTPLAYYTFWVTSGKGGLAERTSIAKHVDVKKRDASCVKSKKYAENELDEKHAAPNSVLSKWKKHGRIDGTALCHEILCAFK